MPKTGSIRVNAKYSNVSSASSHETANVITIDKYDIGNILDLAENLKGEDAVEEIIRFFDTPNDEYAREYALHSVVRFYSNVRFFVKELKELLSK